MSRITGAAQEVAREILKDLSGPERASWVFAVLLYGVGDVLTTVIGSQTPGVGEIHPISARILDLAGTAGMVAAKLVVLAVAFAAFLIVPSPHRLGIPLGLIIVGLVVVVNNIRVAQGHPGFGAAWR